MKLLSTNGDPGVIAVSQSAIGIFAIGQFARGVIAVGQLAIGVVALGQGCVSVVGVGQGGIGVAWFAGMIGIGGRGICLRLIPGLDPPRVAPQGVPFESLANGPPSAEGFVRAGAIATPEGARLAIAGKPLPVRPTPTLAWALDSAQKAGKLREVFAHVKRVRDGLVCDRIIEVPGSRATYPLYLQILRVALLVGVAVVWWWAMGVHVSP